MFCEKHCKGCLFWYLCCFYFYFADPCLSMEVFKALSFDPHTMQSSQPVGGPSSPQEALVCLHKLSSMVLQLLQAFSRYLSPLMCSCCQHITRHCSFLTVFSSVSVLVILVFLYREWITWKFLQEIGLHVMNYHLALQFPSTHCSVSRASNFTALCHSLFSVLFSAAEGSSFQQIKALKSTEPLTPQQKHRRADEKIVDHSKAKEPDISPIDKAQKQKWEQKRALTWRNLACFCLTIKQTLFPSCVEKSDLF